MPNHFPKQLHLTPITHFQGQVMPPGSKSIANRVLPLAAFGKGSITLSNIPDGEDVQLMIKALQTLGVSMEIEQDRLQFPQSQPFLGSGTLETPTSLFLGNSGTCIRFLTALLCGTEGHYLLDGIDRMQERPIEDLVNALIPILGKGGNIQYTKKQGYPPLSIQAAGLSGLHTSISGDLSSQFISGLLMALPLAKKPIHVKTKGKLVSKPYIDLTLEIQKYFGATVEWTEHGFICAQPDGYTNPPQYKVEVDPSSASYFLAAGAIGKGPVTVHGVGSDCLQAKGEGGFAYVLERMGAKVTVEPYQITVAGGNLRGIEIDMDQMTDTGMTLAIVALFAKGPTYIKGIGNWKLKETNRIEAMAKELTKCGAQVEAGNDYLKINPPKHIQKATIETYQDHRMAMCFSLVPIGGQPITLENPKCVEKTYPSFFSDLKKISHH